MAAHHSDDGLEQSAVMRRATHVVVAHGSASSAAQQLVSTLKGLGYGSVSSALGGAVAHQRIESLSGLRLVLCVQSALGDMPLKQFLALMSDDSAPTRIPVVAIAPRADHEVLLAHGAARMLQRPLPRHVLGALWECALQGMATGVSRAEARHGEVARLSNGVQEAIHDFWKPVGPASPAAH